MLKKDSNFWLSKKKQFSKNHQNVFVISSHILALLTNFEVIKFQVASVKIIKNNLPRFQLMTEDSILNICLCICV